MKRILVTKIYDDAVDKNVAATVLYANGGAVYFEGTFENQVSKAVLENLFVKGLVIVHEGKTYRPICVATQGNKAKVSIVVGADSVVELASAEEVAE